MVSKVGLIPLFHTACRVCIRTPGIILRDAQGREIWIVKLQGVDSLTESETLRGQTLLVSSTDRPELEDEDEFLVQVLICIQDWLHTFHSLA